MVLTKYKSGFRTMDPRKFKLLLANFGDDLINEKGSYLVLKRFVKHFTAECSKVIHLNVIEKQYYRIMTGKLSLIFIFVSILQNSLEIAEQQLNYERKNNIYLYKKRFKKAADDLFIEKVVHNIIPGIVSVLDLYTNDKLEEGIKTTEINNILENSKFNSMLSMLPYIKNKEKIIYEEEDSSRIKYNNFIDELNEISRIRIENIEKAFIKNTKEDNFIKKLTIIYLPYVSLNLTSFYWEDANTLIVSEFTTDEDIEEFLYQTAIYFQYSVTGSTERLPQSFKEYITEDYKYNIEYYRSIFAHHIIKDTSGKKYMSHTNKLIEDYQLNYDEFVKDSSYFERILTDI